MRILARVDGVVDFLHRLVDPLVPLVSVTDGKLRALLDVEDERNGDTRLPRPVRVGQTGAISDEVPAGRHVSHGLFSRKWQARSATSKSI